MGTKTNNGGTTGFQATGGAVRVISAVVNFATVTVAAADVVQVLNIPANTLILDAGVEVLTGDTAGASGTMALGDGTTTWVTAAVTTATGQMTNASVANIVKNAADTLDLTIAVGTVNSKVRVWAVVADLSSPNTSQTLTFV